MFWSPTLRYGGLGLILTVLAAAPFFRGLFFWTELLAAILLVAVAFLLWLAGRRLGALPTGLPGGAAGWSLLALLACYLAQSAWAVYPRGNLDWILRAAAAWMLFATMRTEAGPALRRWLGWLFVWSASGVALWGFLEYSGYLSANPALGEALSVVGLQHRMYTVFQYPNTAAVYFIAAMTALCGLAVAELRPGRSTLAGGLMALMGLAFFFTMSRGAILTLPFGLILLLVGLPRERRWPALLLWLVAFLPVLLTMNPIGHAVAAGEQTAVFQWIALATAMGLSGGLLLSYLVRLQPRLQAGLIAVAVVAGVAGLAALRPAGGLLPERASRLLSINLRATSVVSRLTFTQDALRVAVDHPLGLGGSGWERSYRQYQQIAYTANEAHNHYAQTAIEAGLPGLAALFAALVGGLWAAWKGRRAQPVAWAFAVGASVIAAHSLIDFNLSFGAVWLLLWGLLGAAGEPSPAGRFERAGGWAAGGATFALGGLTALLLLGSYHLDRALALEKAGQLDAAKAAARQAARYDRWNSRPLRLLGDKESLEQAARLDPNEPQARFALAVELERRRDFQGALREAESALKSYPLASVYWAKVGSLGGRQMVDALHNGQLDEARRLADYLASLGEEFERRQATAEALAARLWVTPPLEMAHEFRLRYGQALYLTGEMERAEPYLVAASKEGLHGAEGHVWLFALYERRGDRAAMANLAGKPWVRFREQNPVYKAIRNW